MNIKLTLPCSILALLFIAVPLKTQAALFTIDNFTQNQSIISEGGVAETSAALALTSGLPAGSTELNNAQRTLFSQSTGDLSQDQRVRVIADKLQISNSPLSAGTAWVLWDNFDTVDFLSLGINAFLLDVLAIDLDVNLSLTVNGVSTSPLQNFAGAGQFFVDFNDFSNPGVFTAVESIRLDLNGPNGWDAEFKLFGAINPSTVPEPSLFILLSFALIAFGFVKNRAVF